ncbi:phthiocerol/phthiodiolone dimycocerosyl transferase family protein [Rhizobium sp. Rhizsp42]|uniref:phthiocerol/phthiodiolone dimycocerosyl transferase family protein n=1 Tax=Rhizobium sp. Rhizsp42 TaxID=3243034 RepID=UPI0039B0E939
MTDWLRAAEHIGRQLTFASAQIKTDNTGHAIFEIGEPRGIPITVAEGDPRAWTDHVEDELSQPVDALVDPLIRLKVISNGSLSTLILTMHHSVGDGPSSVHLIRDILQATNGQMVTVAADFRSLEQAVDDLSMPIKSFPPVRTDALFPPPGYRPADIERPQVRIGSVAKDEVTALRTLAREQGATLHGALSAAAARAFAALAPHYAVVPPRVFSPVDARRRLLKHTENLGAYVNAVTVDTLKFSENFWEDARHFSSKVGLFNDPDVLAFGVRGVRAALAGNPTVAETAAVWAHVYGAEILMTNLGVLEFPTNFGDVRVTGIWGPAVSTGISQEQTLGIASLEGTLRILHTSFEPLDGLVETMLDILIGQLTSR